MLALRRGDRPHAAAVVAYLFRLDDLADSHLTETTRVMQLEDERIRFRAALATHEPADAELDVLVRSIGALGLSETLFERQFDALIAEVRNPTFETYADWFAAVEPLAAVLASIGSTTVLARRPEVWGRLRDLFVGLTAADVLVDVDADLDRGRILLPLEDLRRFGAHPGFRRVTPSWRDLMRFEIARARSLLDNGSAGVELLEGRAKRFLRIGIALYSQRLRAIEHQDYDVFSSEIRVPRRRQAWVAFRAALSRGPVRPAQAAL